MILVSGCLIGINCKYNGRNNLQEQILLKFKDKGIIPVCPEQLGGLTTPRLSAEIQGGEGKDVLEGLAKVVREDGVDITEAFVRGAEETLRIAQSMGVTHAILKARSPSCGAGEIYDGSFLGELKKGDGVTTALLKQNRIAVYTEESPLFDSSNMN